MANKEKLFKGEYMWKSNSWNFQLSHSRTFLYFKCILNAMHLREMHVYSLNLQGEKNEQILKEYLSSIQVHSNEMK